MAVNEMEPEFTGDAPAAAQESALRDRRELALVAVERTRMPMVVTDPRKPDNPIVLANQAFLHLTGYTADEVLGRNCRFLQGRDTADSDVDALRQKLAAREDHVAVELLNYRKDGSTFWNQLSISAVHGDDGELLYYFASQKDVTTKRRSEELEASERLLLKEVDHRAMNALALVQSIVRLSRTDSVEGYSNAILGRVDALARAHRLLAHSGWTGAALTEILDGEIPRGERRRIEVTGCQSLLPALLVQPLALVLHELMSNAVAHGALARPHGRLQVRWEIGAEPRQLVIRWQETGSIKTPSAPVPGFGMSTMKGVIERQLGGKAALEWHDEGLHAHLTIPMLFPMAAPAA